MTNYEKYREEIEKFTDREVGSVNCFIAHEIRKYNGCRTKCNNCILDNLNFLFSDDKEPIKLTQFEFDFFNNVDPEYKWIVRDEDGGLCLYEDKPQKGNGVWFRMEYDIFSLMYCLNHLFTFVKWEDEEPTNIKELLATCEVVDDD